MNNKIITLNYTLKDGDKKLVLGTDYTEVYENSLIAGKATLKIYGKGKYTGMIKKTFNSLPELKIKYISEKSGHAVLVK